MHTDVHGAEHSGKTLQAWDQTRGSPASPPQIPNLYNETIIMIGARAMLQR